MEVEFFLRLLQIKETNPSITPIKNIHLIIFSNCFSLQVPSEQVFTFLHVKRCTDSRLNLKNQKEGIFCSFFSMHRHQNIKSKAIKIYPSLRPTLSLSGLQGAAVHPSCQWARGWRHPGQVGCPSTQTHNHVC